MGQPADSQAIMELAQELARLAAVDQNEIKLRSAISRAYYAAFLLARDKLKVPSGPGTPEIHREVINQVRRRSKMFGDYLYELKELRKTADYDFPAVEARHTDWNKNWEYTAVKVPFLLSRFMSW